MPEPKKSPRDPAGEIGRKRTRGRRRAGRDAHHVERGGQPDARIDERLPEESAREHPDGSAPALDRKTQYKNTDEAF
jgi:hypothetical protein